MGEGALPGGEAAAVARPWQPRAPATSADSPAIGRAIAMRGSTVRVSRGVARHSGRARMVAAAATARAEGSARAALVAMDRLLIAAKGQEEEGVQQPQGRGGAEPAGHPQAPSASAACAAKRATPSGTAPTIGDLTSDTLVIGGHLARLMPLIMLPRQYACYFATLLS
eukprot:scaffold65334_cov32-Tisochrysis_lutea.AAC.3